MIYGDYMVIYGDYWWLLVIIGQYIVIIGDISNGDNNI